jgi:6-phosphogluconolactonase (cycloisomerase 2 family)
VTCLPIDVDGRLAESDRSDRQLSNSENGDSGTIVVFRIGVQSGMLRPTGQTVHVPKPVCIKMIPKTAGATH